jgi:hypothetical protein
MSYKLTESDAAALATLAASKPRYQIDWDGAWRVEIGEHAAVAPTLGAAIREALERARPRCPECRRPF